ncbi:MAG: preprotein translocase subunit YajC [Lachnospiraceae bacterium]|nr:preprotein translocase subunit YajC [Lachnospiraceae bacterium]
MGNVLLTAQAPAAGGGIMMLLVYVVLFGGFFYFMAIRPQKKERNRIQAMMEALEVGDSVLTNSGFYGVIIDISDETVIVEFGSNRNCRIPMQKSAIAQIEKPESSQSKDKEKDSK